MESNSPLYFKSIKTVKVWDIENKNFFTEGTENQGKIHSQNAGIVMDIGTSLLRAVQYSFNGIRDSLIRTARA